MTVSGSWYSLSCANSGSHAASVSGGPTTFTLNPTVDFANLETCTLTLTAAGLAQPLQVALTGRGTDPPPDSGGGCSIASGGSGGRGGVDPLLALLTVGALGVLVARRRRGGRDGRR